MVLDVLSMFSNGASVETGNSSVLDFGQADARSGLARKLDLCIVVQPGEGFAASSFAFDVQHSDDNSTFTTLISVPASTAFEGAVVPMPVDHKRYIRLAYTVTGGAGKVNAAVTDSLQDLDLIDQEIE